MRFSHLAFSCNSLLCNPLFLFVALALLIPPVPSMLFAETISISCSSSAGKRQHCPADVSQGVLLKQQTSSDSCLLGRSWGYDQTGVWVTEGCSAEFLVHAVHRQDATGHTASEDSETVEQKEGVLAAGTVPDASSSKPPLVEVNTAGEFLGLGTDLDVDPISETRVPYETWGTYDPGEGFLVGQTEAGSLSISGYALARYMNQNDSDKVFTDHLGRERTVDPRDDLYSHRVMAFLKGWIGVEELLYNIIFWTVNTTDQDAIFGTLGYQFAKEFSLYAGINGNPGSRSLQGSHPYWLGHDRVMADEFFRPYFSQGIWATGEPIDGLWYSGMIGNNSSTLGTTASQLDRSKTKGLSLWWMPSTGEFGPRGAYGDWEEHQKFATRFGISTTFSPEDRQTDSAGLADNTALRLADSVNVFDTGSLAEGVTVQEVDYKILALDAGFKYRGFFFQVEVYQRWLDEFEADGELPVDEIVDRGFYVQTAFFPLPRKLELYAVTSQIFGDDSAGFGDSSEYGLGLNFYPANTRNHRFNLQVLHVIDSPVNSTFGYYTGGQEGTNFSAAFSVFF